MVSPLIFGRLWYFNLVARYNSNVIKMARYNSEAIFGTVAQYNSNRDLLLVSDLPQAGRSSKLFTREWYSWVKALNTPLPPLGGWEHQTQITEKTLILSCWKAGVAGCRSAGAQFARLQYGSKALIAKPNFHSRTIFDENMVLMELNRLKVHFNKPIYTDFIILDI